MPTVPVYQRQSQSQAAPVNTQDLRIPKDNAFTALADVGSNALNVYQKEMQRVDLADMQDKLNQFSVYADDLYNNPQNGLITLQGKNAIGQGEAFAGQISAKATELRDSIPEYMRQAFDQQIQPLGRSYGNRARQYEVGQKQQFERQAYSSGNELAISQSRGMWGDDAAFGGLAKSRFDATDLYADTYGMPDEWRISEKVRIKESMASSAIDDWIANDPQSFISRNGEPSDLGGVSRFSAHGNSSAARGLRNNNPGNIEASDKNPWEGQTGSDGRFAKFETPEHGIRALGKNLITYYQKHGLDTVGEIITRWAPPKENKTDAYIKAICEQLGVAADQQIDVTNPRTLAALCAGIVNHENGSQPYTDEQIGSGVSAALGLSALESQKRYTGNTIYDAASPQSQMKANRYAMQVIEKQRTEFRVGLEGRVKDAEAAYLMGKDAPNAPSFGEFITAYGEKNGPIAYEQFRDTQQLGSDIAAVQQLSPSAQQALLEMREPSPGDGFDAATKRQRILRQAVDTVNAARSADPIQYATSLSQVDPINIGNPAALQADLVKRASSAVDVSRKYQTPLTMFSKQEAAQLGEMLRTAPASQSVSYLDAMRQGLGTGAQYSAAMQQISSYAPSAAVAGAIMGKSGNVIGKSGWISDSMVNPDDAAKTIIEGANARAGITSKVNGVENRTKGIEIPKDSDLRPDFVDAVGNAFAGDAAGAAQAYEVAKDYYAGLMAKKGDVSGEYDRDAWTQAINVATGGVYDYNGQGEVLLPWGMSEGQFDSAVNTAWQSQIVDAGIKAPPGQYGLQSFGDSQYLIKLGAGYLLGKDGNPVVLRINAERVRLGNGGIPQ
ncbi:hypothetical protein [Serratia marcescens]|uniref:hypothetical protein n=1 Tax=Serratia marcescens TaxID=615 RepID=UPI000745620B|nr:hypothetical protein [Serratia marcescens]CVF52072.1 Uncharacterised protein [Serratia marcescens]HEJ7836584.1 hypothetical protein [Serratia marcescens]